MFIQGIFKQYNVDNVALIKSLTHPCLQCWEDLHTASEEFTWKRLVGIISVMDPHWGAEIGGGGSVLQLYLKITIPLVAEG